MAANKGLLALLGVAAVGGIAALVGGGAQRSAEGYKVLDEADALRRWNATRWGPKVQELSVQLSSPQDVAVEAAKWAFPGYPWPATPGAGAANVKVWNQIQRDVYAFLGVIETPPLRGV